MSIEKLLEPISQFLKCETPNEWVQEAIKEENLEIILIDHLVCELKAAQSAMFLIRKYAVDKESGDALLNWLKPFEEFIYKKEGDWQALANKNKLSKSIVPKANSLYGQNLIDKMILLIKEELHHFFQVLEIMHEYKIEYKHITPGRYAKGMLSHVKTHEPDTLIDKLICGAYIEARSCERFAKLAPHVDKRLGDFYISLLRSEARHYQDYITLAEDIVDKCMTHKNKTKINIKERIEEFGRVEAELILLDDPDFKFHSGKPKN